METQNEGGERKGKKAKIGKLFSLTWSSVLYFVYRGGVLFCTPFQEVSVLRTSACSRKMPLLGLALVDGGN